jgi:hypothetical protein
MESAFLAVVAKPGRRLSDDHRRVVDCEAPDRQVLAFPAAAHLAWRSRDDRTAVGVWQDAPEDRGTRWTASADALTVTCGVVRLRGRRWSAEGAWAGDIAAMASPRGLRAIAADLAGTFAAARFDHEGGATVVTDPVGMRLVYHAETDDVFVVSSRSQLAAAAVAGRASPRRDPLRVACLPSGPRPRASCPTRATARCRSTTSWSPSSTRRPRRCAAR